MNNTSIKQEILENGFTIIADVYTNKEVENLLQLISEANISNPSFRKTNDLFAIREFLKLIPEAATIIFNDKLKAIVSNFFGDNYFLVKSIYFDKPETSNWFVAYHQDLTISVNKKIDLEDFNHWIKKEEQFSVHPPVSILENNFTIRIHLDDADENNGALKLIPASHKNGISRAEEINFLKETEVCCNIQKGGIMIMKPLLLHASSRTINNKKRRVIHIEFSNEELPGKLQWAEKHKF